jgi:hypothetical protein
MLAVFAAAAWSIQRWRSAIKIAMVLLIFEGALRKWVFPGAQDLLYFAKDLILAGAYVGFVINARNRPRFELPPAAMLYGSIGMAAVLGSLEIFNPNLPNLLVGVLGFKAYFLYVPLMFVVPAAFDSDRDLAQFLRWYALLALPVGLLAIFQFLAPAGSSLNAYARSNEVGYVATFGSSTHVRVTGTFAFISGYTSYLLATVFLLLAILGTMSWRWKGALLLYGALGVSLLGILMSGSRAPVVMIVALFPVYWWFAVVRERGTGATAGRLLLAGSLVLGLVIGFGDQAVGAFLGRARGIQDVRSRLSSPFMAPMALLPVSGVLGLGIGATHQTAAAVTKGVVPYSWLGGLLIEQESGRVMIELGGLGFGLVYLVRILLVFFAMRQIWILRTRFHRSIATAALLLFVSQIPGGIVFDVTAGVYYWFFAGLLMLAVRLDRVAVPAASSRPTSGALLRQQRGSIESAGEGSAGRRWASS